MLKVFYIYDLSHAPIYKTSTFKVTDITQHEYV